MDLPLLEARATDEADLPLHILEQLRLAGGGVTIARFAGFDPQGRFLVQLPDREATRRALSTIGLRMEDIGAQVAVALEQGDPPRPIVLGLVMERRPAAAPVNEVRLDGECLRLEAARQIELRCGEASIVLTAAGKVLIRGNYVMTRSRGANRIRGAFVDIN